MPFGGWADFTTGHVPSYCKNYYNFFVLASCWWLPAATAAASNVAQNQEQTSDPITRWPTLNYSQINNNYLSAIIIPLTSCCDVSVRIICVVIYEMESFRNTASHNDQRCPAAAADARTVGQIHLSTTVIRCFFSNAIIGQQRWRSAWPTITFCLFIVCEAQLCRIICTIGL